MADKRKRYSLEEAQRIILDSDDDEFELGDTINDISDDSMEYNSDSHEQGISVEKCVLELG